MTIERNLGYQCSCDHGGCKEMKYSFLEPAWQMKSIVFGIHPRVLHWLGRRVKCVRQSYFFCNNHFDYYKMKLFGDINLACCSISSNADFEQGKGCWITLVDVLGGPAPINYQMAIEPFEEVFSKFSSFVEKNNDR